MLETTAPDFRAFLQLLWSFANPRFARCTMRQLLGRAATTDQHLLAARPIMLIDDVMTTGATLFEAARTLQKSGAGPICVLVIARVN